MAQASESPSNCTYCYQLECSVKLEPTASSGGQQKKATVSAKNAIVTVGRNSQRNILIQVELKGPNRNGQPAVASYDLRNAVVHQQQLVKGMSSIEIPSRNIILQLSNCAPRKLNVFVKSLQAKLDIMKAENGPLRTPVTVARSKLTSGLPNVFNVLSPLSIGEIRKVRKMRGLSSGESPLAKNGPTTSQAPKKGTSATTPISAARDRRILASSIGLKRMRTFAGFEDEKPHPIHFVPLKSIAEENEAKNSTAGSNRIELSEEQKSVVRSVVHNKQNVFFTGSAGTGKSVILKRVIEMLPAATTFITAATGVAACQIGGVTLHSFAGIGIGDGTEEQCFQRALGNKNVVRQWKQCAHLIIDEISMIDKNYFSKLEYVARGIRNKDAPFGGIQLIITGDFLQLPPVTKDEQPQFCFESDAWTRCISKTIVLEKVKRQEDDTKFVKILNSIRYGMCDQKTAAILADTAKNEFKDDVVPTRLCTHTADATRINEQSLGKLEENEKVFHAHDEGYIPDSIQSMVVRKLVLKVGCQVMLTKNIDLSKGLSNGSRGCVKGYSENGNPLVHFLATNRIVEIRRSKFGVRIPGTDVSIARTQVPLQLAWAISIHKSQGLTLDCVEMSLEKVFADGQAYVALSRARSLAAIRVLGFDAFCVRANQKVVEYYKDLTMENAENSDDDGFFLARKRSRMSL